MREYEVAIIGAGPAGIAAAVQLARYGIDFVLFEKDSVGGLVRNANMIENYPGFPCGLSGTRFVRLLKEHLQRLRIETTIESVTKLSLDGDSFALSSVSGLTRVRRVVIASGTVPIRLTSPVIPYSLINKVFHEVYPIMGVTDKHIAIIGSGDAAFDYALNLARQNNVSILMRGGKARCLPLLLERSEANDQVRIHYDTTVESVEASPNGMLLRCCNNDRDDTLELQTDYLLVAIGRKPSLAFIDDDLNGRMKNLIDSGKLYMIGDVANGLFRQATIAAGDGVKAAMKIYNTLREDRT